MGIRNQISGIISLVGSAASMYLLIKGISRPRRVFVFQDKVVLITGGSRGLGLVLARKLAAQGAKLALLAHSQEELEQVGEELRAYDCEVLLLSCDLRDQAQVNGAVNRIIQRFGRLDVIINNAGIVQLGTLENMQLQDFQDAMDIHFWGPLYTIMASKDIMRKQGGGRIANITSISGNVGIPHLAPYSASKSALMGLSDSLRAELAKKNILITTVIPGLMHAESNALYNHKAWRPLDQAWFSIVNSLPIASVSLEQGAEQILEAIRRGEPSLVISPEARILILGNAIAPGIIANLMKLANRLIPGKIARTVDQPEIGWDNQSRLSPSTVTTMSTIKTVENYEHTLMLKE